MKQGTLRKKVGSLLLAASMIAASLSAFSAEVHAAELPDTSLFVTKEQLKNFDTNDTDADKKDTPSAKVYFGNKSDICIKSRQ